MRKLFLTFFYSGLSPKAPGTIGTIAGVVVAFFILSYFPSSTLGTLLLFITIVGVLEINRYEKETSSHDSKEIVIDEVAGIWMAILLCINTPDFFKYIVTFIYFRIFDIWKPSIIGRIDENVKGGLGVMGDDLIAGIVAGICSAGTYQIYMSIF